jgi:hypothetical protein
MPTPVITTEARMRVVVARPGLDDHDRRPVIVAGRYEMQARRWSARAWLGAGANCGEGEPGRRCCGGVVDPVGGAHDHCR